MNIHQMANRTGIALRDLRKLDRLKVLKLDRETPASDAIRFHLSRNPRLTVEHMLALIDEPDILDELSPKHAARVKTQMAALDLDNSEAPLAPIEVAASVASAARTDAAAAATIAHWLMGVLPSAAPVSHHWVAVRLLAPSAKVIRDQDLSLIGLALVNVRRVPEFAGYWKSETINGKPAILYQKPKLALDL